ncbi:hypothetical protein PUR71_07945 [Streptomyces sp. SP17BM10]|uniref:hypothetical protein n=1 Tax=Streptomyces sp. SP17BM10 TaxID=3002530 RepID=UPI002E770821|nr:hypothetical protein [Streptomyces sp. SP17BM10]MEE1782846.1 hypothetical protein [Streptomyces sp. SP17BM10]
MYHAIRRTIPALTALGIAAGAPLLSPGTAHAEPAPECGAAGFSYSTDGGRTWQVEPRLDKPYGVIMVEGDFQAESEANCSYEVSLAAYGTEGPTWPTSGQQTFLGRATGTVTRAEPRATLDVSSHLPECYGQIDLYLGGETYDGVEQPLPHYPNSVLADEDRLLAAWNGGHACEPTPTASPTATPTTDPTTGPTATPTATATATATATPTATAGPTGSPTATSSPTATPSRTAGPTVSPTGTPTATGSPSAAPGHGESPSAPSPSASGSPAAPGGSLAHTGGDGGRTLAYGAAGAALLAAGTGAVVVARRRTARR